MTRALLRSVVLLATPALLATALAVPAGAAATGLGAESARLPGIDWRACIPGAADGAVYLDPRDDVQCADVTVPVEYAEPGGRTITVAVTRIPATGSSAVAPPEGVVFGNPGGPGLDARAMWRDAVDRGVESTIDQLNRTHDLVSVQPRGLEGAGASHCGGATRRVGYEQRAKACLDADPAFVASLTTENVVRDTDMVRELMGVERINFVGYSYGTAVGMVYQSLFPERLERVVLDSSVGPSSLWWRQGGALAAEQRRPARDAFLAWIARHHEQYGLGSTATEVYWWLREQDQAAGVDARRYLPPTGGEGFLGHVTSAGEQAGVRVDNAVGAVTGRFTQPSRVWESAFAIVDRSAAYPASWPHGAAELEAVVSGVAGGDVERFEGDDDEAVTTAEPDTYIGIVRCNENTTPTEPMAVPALALSVGMGSSTDEIEALRLRAMPCPFPASAIPPVTRANPLGAPPLVLQSDHDPYTPGRLGPLTAEATGGVLVRVEGVQHALFGFGNAGVDQVVLNYLRTGEAPAGLTLPAAPAPVPW